jgi:hypothetical protein
VAVLRVHQRQQATERYDWGAAWRNTGYVFTIETGESIHPDYVSRHFTRLVRHANQLKVGSQGRAVKDVQRALGIEPSGAYGKDTRQAVFEFERDQGDLTANGIVDPHTWYRLFPDQPLRPYPHPGYLPPIRLHDLRHLAATLAQVSEVASDASFGGSREHALPAVQRAALGQARSRDGLRTMPDLGCHHPVASGRTMMQPVRLQRMPA